MYSKTDLCIKPNHVNTVKLLFALGLFSVFVGCNVEDSGDVNQDKIWTQYELFYNENDDKTVAVARFRFGGATGTLLKLNEDASVSFNGEELDYNAWYLGHTREFAGWVDSGAFVYMDLDQLTFTNTVMPYDSVGFPDGFDTIYKSMANTLVWDGTPLAANEHVGLFVGSWAWGDDALYVQSVDNATDIVMGTNQLSNVPVGPSTLFMDRWTQVDAAQATSEGGIVVGKYRATNRQVQVVN
jgi:hypothetical protein